jgi:hypothetical protein
VSDSSVSAIASSRTWIESDAIQQLRATASLAGMRRAVGMPDLHPGKGAPIGAVFACAGWVFPYLIGNSTDADRDRRSQPHTLNECFRLAYVPELVARKVEGSEKVSLGSADLRFHEREYARLLAELEHARDNSRLPEVPSGRPALHDLLVRIRLGGPPPTAGG